MKCENTHCKNDNKDVSRWELIDSRGYSCGVVCNDCHDKQKAKYNPIILEHFVEENRHTKWSTKVGRIREIDRLQMIDKNISQEELEKIIRATAIGKFGPRLKLHGHEFRYYKEKK